MIDPNDVQRHRIAEPEVEFLSRFPDAREAAVYEFDNEREAGAARSLLMAAAFGVGKGRVLGVPWKTHWRLVAVPY